MDDLQLLELKGIIEKRLIMEIIEQASAINTDKDSKLRFTLEFNYTPRGEIAEVAVESRARRVVSVVSGK